MANDATGETNSLEKASDLGKSPRAIAKRWKLELKLADKRESDWRKRASDIYKAYTPSTPANNTFNILWTNTETLRQSVYNSLPQPQVKRRYSDEDQLGKAVSDVLTRSLEFSIDTYDMDGLIKSDVLSMLLPGRAVSRVRYVPDIKTVEDDDFQESESFEEIEWERVIAENVQWDDFRILCAAKTWEEVTAIGFRHRLTREDCIDKFGEEIGNEIPLDSVDDEDVKTSKDTGDLFKTAEIWEIWDKEEKEVVFICPTYAEPCKVQDDPMNLFGFFPIPRPLYAIENNTTLVPAALFTQYEQQAKELNKISARINKLIDALKVRGIYDSTLTELGELMKGGDNDLIAAANATALIDRGGLEKAIWMMPIDTAANVLKELYVQRDATKQVIYEITGISDIMRSASDPNETFGAQKIKTQWGTQRLQRIQKEVQRYIRDIIRIKAEIIAEKFQVETLEKMTLLNIPHKADIDKQYDQAMQQYQMQSQQMHMQAMQQGQQAQLPPPPQYPNVITWEKVEEALHDDATRTYRIDIETDSTLSATQDSDLSGIKDVLGAVAATMQTFGPMMQAGDLDILVVKELLLAITRRARMGSQVEDAIDKMKQPQPQGDPNAAKVQADSQIAMQKMQADAQIQQATHQHEAQLEQFKAQSAAQVEQLKAQVNQASEQARMQADAQVEQARANATIEVEKAKLLSQFQIDEANRNHALQLKQMEHSHAGGLQQQQIDAQIAFDKWKAELDAATKIAVAEITAKTTMGTALMSAENAANSQVEQSMQASKSTDGLKQIHSQTLGAIQELTQAIGKPKKVLRDESGKIIGTE